MINLLIINVSYHSISSIHNILQPAGITFRYTCTSNEEETLKALQTNNQWDLILISEKKTGDDFPMLKQVAKWSEATPILFITENPSKETAAAAMRNGASDCLSAHNLNRLLPVIKKGLEYKRMTNARNKTQHKEEIELNIIDNILSEVYLFDIETFRCIYLNQTALHNKIHPNQGIGKLSPTDIYADYGIDSFQKLVSVLLQQKQEKISACTRKKARNQTTPWVEMQLQIVSHENNSTLLAVNNDISYGQDKTRALKKQQKLTHKYLRNSKQKSDLLVNAQHDMRTSLNSIIISSKLLIEKHIDETRSDFSKLTNAIHHSGNYLLEYIDSFFDAPEEHLPSAHLPLQLINIQTLGQMLYHIFAPIAKRNNIAFSYKVLEPVQLKIKTHSTYLKRILANIISNAFKYTQQGSVNFLIYKPVSQELHQVDLGTGNVVAFQVKDTGIGISEHEQSQVFKRYYRSIHSNAEQKNGLGLGLDICKQLTDVLGGKLHVKSELNVGSTFTLYLPTDNALNKNDGAANCPKFKLKEDRESEYCDHTDKTILIVDDSKVHNLATKEYLNTTFNNCITTSSKNKAFQILKKQPIDCIVLDYVLTDGSSLEVIKHLKSQPRYAHIPIIIYTGKKLSQNELDELNKYTNTIVKKSVNSYETLVRAIHTCLEPSTSPN